MMDATRQKILAEARNLEDAVCCVLEHFLPAGDFEIIEGPRREYSGSQHGRDVLVRFRRPSASNVWTVAFECKNQRSPIGFNEVLHKPFQALSAGMALDGWALIAPHAALTAEALDGWEVVEQRLPFGVSVIDADHGATSFLALNQEAFRRVYGDAHRPSVDIRRWVSWLEELLYGAESLRQRLRNLMTGVEVVTPSRWRFDANAEHRRRLAEEFYGGSPTWEQIVAGVDAPRLKAAASFAEILSDTDAGGLHMILVLSEAATGKTTFLMRQAFDLASNDRRVIYAPQLPCTTRTAELSAALDLIQSRTPHRPAILVLDNIASVTPQLRELFAQYHVVGRSLTVVGADRVQRWRSVAGEHAASRYPAQIHEVVLADYDEVDATYLVQRLRELDIGKSLWDWSPDEFVQQLCNRYGGQLLPFLVEVMQSRGLQFAEIVLDEARELRERNPDAELRYALVCALYRFGISMPEPLLQRAIRSDTVAGIVAHEKAVRAALDSRLLRRDARGHLTSRHELVAEAVFNHHEPNVRFELLAKLIDAVDVADADDVGVILSLLTDASRRSEFWGEPYRKRIYERAFTRLNNSPELRCSALQLALHEDRIDDAYRLAEEQPSIAIVQELARFEAHMGRKEKAAQMYAQCVGLQTATSAEEVVKAAQAGGLIECALKDKRVDEVLLTDWAGFLAGPLRSRAAGIAVLESVSRLGRADAHSIHRLADLLWRQGRIDEANRLLDEASNCYPESAAVFALTCIRWARRDLEPEELAARFADTIAMGSADAHTYYSYARLLHRNSGAAAAIDILRQGMKKYPDPFLCLKLAELLVKSRNFGEAIRVYEYGIRIFPTDGALHNSFAKTLRRQKRDSEAERVLSRSLRINPTEAQTYTTYLALMADHGRESDVRAAFLRGVKAAPSNGALYHAYARFLHECCKDAEADDVFAKAFCLAPRHAPLYVDYGLLLERAGRRRAALHCYQYGTSICLRGLPPLFQVLGVLLGKMARDEEAIAQFEAALAIDPEHVHVHAGWAYLLIHRGDLAGAERILRTGIDSVENARLHLHLARVLRVQGRDREAEEELARACRLADDSRTVSDYRKAFDEPVKVGHPRGFLIADTHVRGVISRVRVDTKGTYGFVKTDAGKDLYFRPLPGAMPLTSLEGARCEFDIAIYVNDRQAAINVEPVDWDDGSLPRLSRGGP